MQGAFCSQAVRFPVSQPIEEAGWLVYHVLSDDAVAFPFEMALHLLLYELQQAAVCLGESRGVDASYVAACPSLLAPDGLHLHLSAPRI